MQVEHRNPGQVKMGGEVNHELLLLAAGTVHACSSMCPAYVFLDAMGPAMSVKQRVWYVSATLIIGMCQEGRHSLQMLLSSKCSCMRRKLLRHLVHVTVARAGIVGQGFTVAPAVEKYHLGFVRRGECC